MITCKAIDRTPDRKIYRLIDRDGKTMDIGVEKLREGIKTGKLNVVNITMGTDGRIIVNENKGNQDSTVTSNREVSTNSLYAMVKKADKVDVNSVIKKAREMNIQMRKIPTKNGLFSVVVSEGNNHILCIPNGVINLGNDLDGNLYFEEFNKLYHIRVDENVIKSLLFTKYLQRLSGNIIVVGGSTLENISYMFAGCNFESIDLRHFDTINVKHMTGLFYNCIVANLDLSFLRTEKVESMDCMFAHSHIHNGIDISNLNTDNVVDTQFMFAELKEGSNIRGLESISFDNVQYLMGMFLNTKKVKLGSFKFKFKKSYKDATNKEHKTMGFMFYNCGFTSIDLSDSFIDNYSEMNQMFGKNSDLDFVSFANSTFGSHVDMGEMFTCTNNLNLVNFMGSTFGEDMYTKYMFDISDGIKKIDFSDCYIGDKANLDCMFKSIEQAGIITFSRTTFAGYVNMSNMFSNTCGIGSVDFSDIIAEGHIDAENMFMCSYVDNIDWSNMREIRFSNTRGMFAGGGSENMDLVAFNTTDVTDMTGMFFDCCATNLDLSYFDTKNVKNMTVMFAGCAAKYLDLSNFNTSKVPTRGFEYMFDNFNGEVETSDARILNAYQNREDDVDIDMSYYF